MEIEVTYAVRFTEKEMQCVANALTALFNLSRANNVKVSEYQATHLMRALHKMKEASKDKPVAIVVPG